MLNILGMEVGGPEVGVNLKVGLKGKLRGPREQKNEFPKSYTYFLN